MSPPGARVLEETLQGYRDLFHHMQVGVYVFHLEDETDDASLRLVLCNPAAERMTRVSAAACVGRRIDEAFPAVRRFGLPAGYARVARTGEPWSTELDYRDTRFPPPVYSVRAFALPNAFVGVVFDEVTARHRAEEELRRSEARHRALIDALPDALYRVAADGALHPIRPGTLAPATVLPHVTGATSLPREPGEVRVTEFAVGDVDLEARVVRTTGDELFALVRDISARKQEDRRKDEFVGIVSHELRTPLTSIRGALGLIEGGVSGEVSPAVRELVGIACANADRLVRLINDMLDLDKMEAGQLTLDLRHLDAVELVDTAILELGGAATVAGVRVVREGTGPAPILGDRDRLLQVLTNLLSNALRFSPSGGRVTVAVRAPAPGWVRITVTDEGPGVPPAAAPQLFRKYAQFGTPTGRRRGSTGLGLAISKGLVEQHGGTIGLAPGPGRGAAFYVELRALVPPEPAVLPAEDLLAELRRGYAESLPAQVALLLERTATARHDPDARRPAISLAHRLNGTAGTYGFAAVSAAAARIERLLDASAADDAGLDAAIQALMACLPLVVPGG